MKDIGKITRPFHYMSKGIETIDVIEAWTDGLPADEAYCIGNAIKYLSRWHKKNGVADLLKVIWYVTRVVTKKGTGNDAVETVQEAARRAKQDSSDQKGCRKPCKQNQPV